MIWMTRKAFNFDCDDRDDQLMIDDLARDLIGADDRLFALLVVASAVRRGPDEVLEMIIQLRVGVLLRPPESDHRDILQRLDAEQSVRSTASSNLRIWAAAKMAPAARISSVPPTCISEFFLERPLHGR